MYKALYRKYRPQTFTDVVGQKHITQTLKNQLIGDRLSHAYLFIGTRGTGKTTCARILSRAINCSNPTDGEPCNKCISCVGIENGSILDVVELDAASHSGVDDVRALREEAIYLPATTKKRVYIIDEAHMLSGQAFNALLKVLEEPPEHILFVLATTEVHKVPATIYSRCQNFMFRRLPHETIAERLGYIAKAENMKLSGDAAQRLSILADGSMRAGISLLDQCAEDVIDIKRVEDVLGLASAKLIAELVKTIADKQIDKALEKVELFYSDGKEMAALLDEIGQFSRDLLVYDIDKDSALISSNADRELLDIISKKLDKLQVLHWIMTIADTMTGAPRNGISKLSVEICIIKMCDVKEG